MDKIFSAVRYAISLVKRYGYSWELAIKTSASEFEISAEKIRGQLKDNAEKAKRTLQANIREAADYARDLAVREGYAWGLAIKIAADEYDIASGDISAEFAARRKERKEREKQKKAVPWFIR